MYRSTWEADRARIIALGQELADARAALATRDAAEAAPTAGSAANAGLTLLLIFVGLILLNAVAFAVRVSHNGIDNDDASGSAQVLRDL